MEAPEVQARRRDTRDIVWGAVINLVGALVRGLRLILLIVLGRLYGPKGVGLYLLVYATMDIFAKVGIMGLDQAVLTRVAGQYADEDMDGVYHTIGQALVLGLAYTSLVTVGLELLAPWVAGAFFGKPEWVLSLRIVAWILPFWTISAILLFATRALRFMQYEVITKGALEPAVTLVLALCLYVLDIGLVGLWFAVLAAAVAAAGLSVYFFTRRLSLARLWRSLWVPQGRWQLSRFALPIGLVDLLNELLKRIDMFLVGRYLSADVLGIYGIAQEAATPIKKIRQAFNPIFIPVISASKQKQDRDSMLHQYRNVTRWILILIACVWGGLVLAGRSLLGLFGAEFTVGFSVVIILTLALAINGVLGISELFILIHKPWLNFVNAAGALLANICLNLVLIPRYGMIGAAAAVLIMYTVLNIARLLEVAVLYKLQPFTSYHAKATGAFVVALGVVWGTRMAVDMQGAVADISAMLLCWGCYFSLLVLMGPAPEEMAILQTWRHRLRRSRG